MKKLLAKFGILYGGGLLLVFALLFSSCKQTQKDISDESEAYLDIQSSDTLIFKGTIPCADCRGIETVLYIISPLSDNVEKTFSLDRIYIGKYDNIFTEKGVYTMERGFDDDPNAIVYILDPAYVLSPEENMPEKYYFVQYSGPENNKILMLDTNKKKINSKLNYTLLKIN